MTCVMPTSRGLDGRAGRSRKPLALEMLIAVERSSPETDGSQKRCFYNQFSERIGSGRVAGAPAEDRAVEQRVAHHAIATVYAAGDLSRRVQARERRGACSSITRPPFW